MSSSPLLKVWRSDMLWVPYAYWALVFLYTYPTSAQLWQSATLFGIHSPHECQADCISAKSDSSLPVIPVCIAKLNAVVRQHSCRPLAAYAAEALTHCELCALHWFPCEPLCPPSTTDLLVAA